MSRDTTVIRLRQPDAVDDPLSELAREGARRMLGQVLIAEADAFVAMWKDVKLPDGRDRVAVKPNFRTVFENMMIHQRVIWNELV